MGAKTNIEIKSRFDGHVLFEFKAVGNTIKRSLQEAVEGRADLRGANLRGADLCGANLCDVNLRGADLRDADLRGANLCDVNLRDADLRGANLCDVNLRDADLCGANLRDANLCDANLCDADLCGANLRDANLCDANLCGCVLEYDNDPGGYGSTDRVLKCFEENAGVRVTMAYENHDAFASRWGFFWRNLIIIREWELVSEKQDGIELSQDKADLLRAWLDQSGYTDKRFTIIKKSGNGVNALAITIGHTSHSIDLRMDDRIDFSLGGEFCLNGNRIVKA